MTKYLLCLLFIILITSFSVAQEFHGTIKGRVLEQSTGKPLDNVNVFISGTTWGSTTDINGYFTIKSLPAGTHEVVASMIGYHSVTKSVTLREGVTLQLEFKLDETQYELQSVEVSGETPDEWKSKLEIFKKRFMGDSQSAADCVIQNPEFINFTWSSPNILTAEVSQPLIIINNYLGYKINCVLVSFQWNTKSQQVQALVRPNFTELTDTTGNLKEYWAKNRKEVYLGSLDNFLKSLVNNSMKEEGFQVFLGATPSVEVKNLHQLDVPLVRKDGSDYDLSFRDYLQVDYVLNDPVHPERSWIKLLYPQVTLDKFGYPLEQLPFEVHGNWARKGIADMLPKYFALSDSL